MDFLDTAHVFKNIRLVCDSLSNSDETHFSMKTRFISAVSRSQDTSIPSSNEGILVQFENERLISGLKKVRVLTDHDTARSKHLYPDNQRITISAKIKEGLNLIETKDVGLHLLINGLIGTILCVKNVQHMRGGSVSSHVGFIWLSPSNWSAEAYARAIVHESVHNSLFLDDMIHTIFPSPERLGEPAALTKSALLQTKRPLDRAYHSACVAVAMMYFDHLMGQNRAALTFVRPLRDTVKQLRTRSRYYSEHGARILDQIAEFLETLDYSLISQSLKSYRNLTLLTPFQLA